MERSTCRKTTLDPYSHAAGETIGSGLLSGNAFVGGMSLTPWMSFGRMIGESIAR